MVAYTLDLTGLSQANRVLNEIRDVSKEGHRIFVPEAGAFYTRQFEIRNSSNGQLLQPGTQYILLNMDRDATIQSGLNVCTVVYIRDMSVTSVTMTYQCVGGNYQNTQSVIEERLKDYLDGTTPADVVGSLAGVPYQLPPEAHLHIGEKTVYGFNDMVTMLGMIKQAIITGDNGMIALLFQHIDMVVADAEKRLSSRIDEATERVDQLDTQTEIGIGRFIFTDNPDNPNTYLGYGEWILNPNVFLYGANLDETPGDLIYIDSGNGNIGRKTYIWQRVESTGAISYSLLSSTSTADEGDTITFTLNTTGLTPGTVIPYTISGVSGADIAGGLLTGKFNIGAGGVATTQVRILEDNLTEGTETLRIRLTNMPTVETSVNIRDTSLSPSISLRFSANSNGTGTITTTNEGQTVYLVIGATNVPAGSVYNLHYNNSTMNDADFTGVRATTVKIDTATTIIPYVIKADYTTETSEVLAVAVSKGTYAENIAATTLTVVDSSKNTEWSVRFSSNTTGTDTITSVDEGATIYAIVEGKYVPNSFSGQLIYSGIDTSANGDLVNPSFPTFAVTAGDSVTYRATIAIKADTLTEGTEVLTATFRNSATNATLATGTIVINDTSTSPTYQLKFSSNTSGTDTITSLNEGGVGYAYLRTTNIPNGTVLQVQWGGTATDADFTSTRATTATVSNGIATVALSVKADTLTEGQETVTIAFLSGGTTVATGSLILNDTSVTPVYNIRFSSNSSGTGTITSTNEGATIYLVVETKNVANNTKLYLKYASVTGTVNNDDFVGTRATEVTVVNNSAIVPMTLRNDLTAEGSETMRASLMTGSVSGPVVDTADLQINDTSVPSFNIYFSTNANGTGSVTGVNEGTTVYCVVETQGVADGTILGLSYSLTSADFEGAVPANVTIKANKGIVAFTMKNDYLTEGNETLVVTALRSNVTIATGTLVINDTSRTQEFTGRWSSTSTGSGTITAANEGATVYYVVDTQNVPNGTVIPLRILEGSTAVPAAQFDTLPTSVTVNNNVGIAAVKFKADGLYETAKTYEAVLTHSTGSSVGAATIRVNDTSYPATVVKFVSGSGTNYTDMTQLEEGNTYYIAIDMRTAPKGTPYQLSFSGTAATLADFVAEGSNIIPNTVYNRVSNTIMEYLPIAVKGDLITEGNETLTVSLSVNGEVRSSQTVTILDTSKNTTMTARFTSASTSNTAIATINEGQDLFLVVTTTAVTDGTSFNIEWSGTGADAVQWEVPPPLRVTITGNRGVIAIKPKADERLDGRQTVKATIVNPDTSTTLGQAQVDIIDTSTPRVQLSLTTSSIPEGGASGFSAMVYGTRLETAYMEFDVLNADGTRAQADWVETLPVRVNSTRTFQQEFSTSLIAKMDKLTEGDETFTVVAKYNGIETSKSQVTIKVQDTSKSEGYSAFFAASSTATSGSKITTVNEGAVFYFIIETTNVASGTKLAIQYPTGVGMVDANDFDGLRSTLETVPTAGRLFIPFSTKADGVVEGNEKFTVRVQDTSGNLLITSDITVVDTSKASVTMQPKVSNANVSKFTVPWSALSAGTAKVTVNVTNAAPSARLYVKYWFDYDPTQPVPAAAGESTATYQLLTVPSTATVGGTTALDINMPTLTGYNDRPTNKVNIRIYYDDWRSVTAPRQVTGGSATYTIDYGTAGYDGTRPYGTKIRLYDLSEVPLPNAEYPFNPNQDPAVEPTQIKEGKIYGIWIDTTGGWYDSNLTYLRYTYDGKVYTGAELLATGQVETAPLTIVTTKVTNYSSLQPTWFNAGIIAFRADKTTEGNKTLLIEAGPTAAFPRKVSKTVTVLDTSTTAGVEGVTGITTAEPWWLKNPTVADTAKFFNYRRSSNVYLSDVVASKSAAYANEELARLNFVDTENVLAANSGATGDQLVVWDDPWTDGPAPSVGADHVNKDIPFSRLKWSLSSASYEDAVWLTYRDRSDFSLRNESTLTKDTVSKPTTTQTMETEISRQLWNGHDQSVILVRLKTKNVPDGTIVLPVYSKTDMSKHLSVKGTVAVVPALNVLPSTVIPANAGGSAIARPLVLRSQQATATYTPFNPIMRDDDTIQLTSYHIIPSTIGDHCRVLNNEVVIPFYMSQVSNTTHSTALAAVDSYKFQVSIGGDVQPTMLQFDFVNYPQLYSTDLGALRTGTNTNRTFYLPPNTVTEITLIGGGGGGGGSGYLGTSNIANGTRGEASTLTLEGSGLPSTTVAHAGGGAGGNHGRTTLSGMYAASMGGFYGNWLGEITGMNVAALAAGRRMFLKKKDPHPNLCPVVVVYMRYTSRVSTASASFSNHVVAYSAVGAWSTIIPSSTIKAGQGGTNTEAHLATSDGWGALTATTPKYKLRQIPSDVTVATAIYGKGGNGGGFGVNEAYGGHGGGAGAIMRVAIVNRGESPLRADFVSGAGGVGGRAGGYATSVTTSDSGYASRVGKDGTRGAMMITRISKIGPEQTYFNANNTPILQPYTSTTFVSLSELGIASTGTELVDGVTYKIYRNVEIRQAFYNKFKRYPKSLERVYITVQSTEALVGGDVNDAGLTVSSLWPSDAPLVIQNSGVIVGLGGCSGDRNYVNSSTDSIINVKLPGPGVRNYSSVQVIVMNLGTGRVLGGGGGGGQSLLDFNRAGGGAPYGRGGLNYQNMVITPNNKYGYNTGNNATFGTPGTGGSYNSKNYGGTGGKWGEQGGQGMYGIGPKYFSGQAAGARTVGTVYAN